MKTASALVTSGLTLLLACPAFARPDWIVNDPAQRPSFKLELEPHLVLSSSGPPGAASGQGWGFGARGTFVLKEEGFADALNDLVALGVGLQIVRYNFYSAVTDRCERFERAPDGVTLVCVDAGGGGDGGHTYVLVPVVLHWSVFLTPAFSAFVEPGVNLYYSGAHGIGLGPSVSIGGRWHMSENVWLTLRVGAPVVSLGLSLPL